MLGLKCFGSGVVASVVAVMCVATAHPARAQAFSSGQIQPVAPADGVDRAKPLTAMPWCKGPLTTKPWDQGRIVRMMDSFQVEPDRDLLVQTAEQLCQHPTERTWLEQATILVQAWMNGEPSLSQAQVEDQIGKAVAGLAEARYRESHPPTDEERFAFADSELTPVQPDPGSAIAKINGAPAWCDKAQLREKWDPGQIERTFKEQYGIDHVAQAALHICQRPNDRTWKIEAGYILQQWMNWTHLDQAGAEASLRARIQDQKWQAERSSLCTTLRPSANAAGSEAVLAKVQWRFFGCGASNDATGAPQWADHGMADEQIGYYLDTGLIDNEIARMYWLLQRVPNPWDYGVPNADTNKNVALLKYAEARYDFQHLDRAALQALLARAPYNDYARTIVLETEGYLAGEQRAYETAIDKLARTDAIYAHILRDVAAQARASWDAEAAKWKPELAHSNEVARELGAASNAGAKGCSMALKKDVAKLVKSIRPTDYNDAIQKLRSDPVANVLLRRLAQCYDLDGVVGAGAIAEIVTKGRDIRGPRSAAHYAVLDAVAMATKDHPSLQVSVNNYSLDGSPQIGFRLSGFLPSDDYGSYVQGIVKSVKKTPSGIHVVFRTDKIAVGDYDCHDDTSRPLRVDITGHIEYYRNCRPTGKYHMQNNTAPPVDIPAPFAEGVRPGVYVMCVPAGDGAYVFYTKSSNRSTKMTSFLGFPL